ncbi:MAG: hypothetical protein HY898_11770 [Deltaproteobacteria bacterium]|nr:hypothetical protein [Deltaproteobacteria bacterium]
MARRPGNATWLIWGIIFLSCGGRVTLDAPGPNDKDGGEDAVSYPVCTPGAQRTCDCAAGAKGVQVCRSDGTGYLPCTDCNGADASVGGFGGAGGVAGAGGSTGGAGGLGGAGGSGGIAGSGGKGGAGGAGGKGGTGGYGGYGGYSGGDGVGAYGGTGGSTGSAGAYTGSSWYAVKPAPTSPLECGPARFLIFGTCFP